MKPKAILFDWNGTLFYVSTTLPDAMVSVAARLGRQLTRADADSIVQRGVKAAEAPELVAAEHNRDRSPREHREFDRMFFEGAGVDALFWQALYERLLEPDFFHPYPDVEEVLKELPLGIRVGIVSNCGWDLRRNFAHFGLEQYVSSFTLSCEHGVVKPEPELFELACEDLGVDAASALMVGDGPASDGAAINVGIPTLILPAVPPGHARGLDILLHLVRD